jgi:hypothetical protein
LNRFPLFREAVEGMLPRGRDFVQNIDIVDESAGSEIQIFVEREQGHTLALVLGKLAEAALMKVALEQDVAVRSHQWEREPSL